MAEFVFPVKAVVDVAKPRAKSVRKRMAHRTFLTGCLPASLRTARESFMVVEGFSQGQTISTLTTMKWSIFVAVDQNKGKAG